MPPIPKRERRAKLRVGYYSADYYNHATAQRAAGLFERHDREKFEIVAFNFSRGQHDSMTERRAGIFAHRAAPIQVSYLGYPGTMAAPFMDYLVADATLIPPRRVPTTLRRLFIFRELSGQ